MSRTKNEPYVDPILFDKDAFGSKKNYQKWVREMEEGIKVYLAKRKPAHKTAKSSLKGAPKHVTRGRASRKKK
ncbi:MAG: hypothetical protein ACK40G_13840 [Cytophagaceae bacterium]